MKNNLNNQKFWTVQLLPLRQEDKEKISMCMELQEKVCIDGKLFGMGWSDDNKNFLRELFSKFTLYTDNYENDSRNIISEKDANYIIKKANESIDNRNKEIKEFNKSQKNNKDLKKELNKINIKIEKNMDVLDFYIKIYEAMFEKSESLETAIKYYKNVQKDDLIIARLKNGKYCIGRVKDNKIKFINGDNAKNQDKIFKENAAESTGFSWRMSVYKWYIIDEYNIPGHISGRFSGRSARRTICPIDDWHMQQLMKIIYYENENVDNDFKGEKLKCEKPRAIKLEQNNIAESLSPYELEDLVFLYIMNKYEKEEFRILPSKCKIDEVRYECYIINKEDTNRVIAFQVKNKKPIDCSIYVDEKIEKIYLYSGEEYTWGKEEKLGNYKESDKVNKTIKNEHNVHNVEIISNEQLFDTYKKSKFFKYYQERGYYKLDN